MINGLWGHFQHDVVALASILISRFEMKSIHKIRWRRKHIVPKLQFFNTWNPNIKSYLTTSSKLLRECIMEIYSIVFDGAEFPYYQEIEQFLIDTQSELRH